MQIKRHLDKHAERLCERTAPHHWLQVEIAFLKTNLPTAATSTLWIEVASCQIRSENAHLLPADGEQANCWS